MLRTRSHKGKTKSQYRHIDYKVENQLYNTYFTFKTMLRHQFIRSIEIKTVKPF